jgi:hypothetical protein
MVDREAPQCKACFNEMPASFRDFRLCAACLFAQIRAAQNRPTVRQPSYTPPHQRLESQHG